MNSGQFYNKIITRHLPHWEAGPIPANPLPLPYQATFNTLTHSWKSSWMSWNENKASSIRVEREKEARVGVPHERSSVYIFKESVKFYWWYFLKSIFYEEFTWLGDNKHFGEYCGCFFLDDFWIFPLVYIFCQTWLMNNKKFLNNFFFNSPGVFNYKKLYFKSVKY